MTQPKEWTLEGTYFETCNCEVVCPCYFLSPPTGGDCTLLIGWHIDKGNSRDVTLDGLNVALAVDSPGHMAEVKWQAALYLDDKATNSQRDELTKIFAGQAGGHLAVMCSQIGELLGVKSVSIDYRAEGKRRSLRIPNVAEAEIEAIEGRGGDVTVNNHPDAVAPGQPGVIAKSKRLTYRDYGLDWEISDKSGTYSAFAYQGP